MNVTVKNVLCVVKNNSGIVCENYLNVSSALANERFVIFNVVDTRKRVLFIAEELAVLLESKNICVWVDTLLIESIEADKVVTLETIDTIADGTAVKTPGSNIFPYLKQNLDDIITIEDQELILAFLDVLENHKMLVENSGLLTVAALKHLKCADKKVVSILSGGNMDIITMSSVIQHGLIERERIFTVSVQLPDKPGELVNVSKVIAKEQGNIIRLEHNQFVSINRNAAVELQITMEAFGHEHKNEIVQALEEKGYQPKIVQPKSLYH